MPSEIANSDPLVRPGESVGHASFRLAKRETADAVTSRTGMFVGLGIAVSTAVYSGVVQAYKLAHKLGELGLADMLLCGLAACLTVSTTMFFVKWALAPHRIAKFLHEQGVQKDREIERTKEILRKELANKSPQLMVQVREVFAGIALPDSGDAREQLVKCVSASTHPQFKIVRADGIVVGFLRITLRNSGAITHIEDFTLSAGPQKSINWRGIPRHYTSQVRGDDFQFHQWRGTQIGSPEPIKVDLWLPFCFEPNPFGSNGDLLEVDAVPWTLVIQTNHDLPTDELLAETIQFSAPGRWLLPLSDPPLDYATIALTRDMMEVGPKR